jgi:hypothetical protein
VRVRLTSPAFANAPAARLLEQAWLWAVECAEAHLAAAGYTADFEQRRGADFFSRAPHCEGLFVGVEGPARQLRMVVGEVFGGLVTLVDTLAEGAHADDANDVASEAGAPAGSAVVQGADTVQSDVDANGDGGTWVRVAAEPPAATLIREAAFGCGYALHLEVRAPTLFLAPAGLPLLPRLKRLHSVAARCLHEDNRHSYIFVWQAAAHVDKHTLCVNLCRQTSMQRRCWTSCCTSLQTSPAPMQPARTLHWMRLSSADQS